jgi:hypothetical protein
MGYPNRIDESAYGLQWYIYNRDYKEFVMVGMKDHKVKGFFTNCSAMELKNGIGYGAEKQIVEAAAFRQDTMQFWLDPNDDDRLFAVFCMEEFVSEEEQQERFEQNQELLLRIYEMECMDITNTFRVANGKSEVYYNSFAAEVAFAYARDMAERNFMNHMNPEGLDPGQRLEARGVYNYKVSENLAGGYQDAMHAVKAWVESANHRSGMLVDHQYLGVGAYYKPASKYRYYFVQEFITTPYWGV